MGDIVILTGNERWQQLYGAGLKSLQRKTEAKHTKAKLLEEALETRPQSNFFYCHAVFTKNLAKLKSCKIMIFPV